MSTGRYQSRVFNFLSQQSLRLRDRSVQTWRQVKVAAVWGVQILLYPIYVGFQGSRLIEKQFQQTVRQALPRLRAAKRALQSNQSLLDSAALTVDHPLANVLQTASQTVALTDFATLHIRGIASRLDTGSLVLVTTQNQVLDLSFEQQTQLTRRIAWETANYWRQRRLFDLPLQSPLVSTFLPPVKAQPNALLPIRVLQKVMAWMQRGSVAVSANLFQESRLAVLSPQSLSFNAATETETALRLAQPSWVAMEVQFYDWLEQAGQVTTDLLLAGLKSGRVAFSDIVAHFAERLTEQPLAPRPVSDPVKLQLPAARDWLPLIDQFDQWLSKVPGLDQPQLPAPSVPEPWLTMEDLFVQPEPALSPSLERVQDVEAQSQPMLQPSRTPLSVWLKRSLGALLPERFQVTPTQPTPTVENPAVWETTDTATLETTIKIARIQLPRPNLPQSESNPISTSLTRSQQSSPMARAYPSALIEFHADQGLSTPRSTHSLDQVAPLSSLDTANQEEAAMLPQTWIDTEAKLVEYVKHPLEQLLEWLDQGMVWIETCFAKIWRWLTHPIE